MELNTYPTALLVFWAEYKTATNPKITLVKGCIRHSSFYKYIYIYVHTHTQSHPEVCIQNPNISVLVAIEILLAQICWWDPSTNFLCLRQHDTILIFPILSVFSVINKRFDIQMTWLLTYFWKSMFPNIPPPPPQILKNHS